MRALLVFASLCAFAAHGQAFELVSAQEMQASMVAPEPLQAKAGVTPGAPIIDIVSPKLGGPITSPTAIELLFQPSTPSAVRPETFKALYGRLRIDITQVSQQTAQAAQETASTIDDLSGLANSLSTTASRFKVD